MSVTSGPGRDPPNWREIKVPPIFTNPTEKAYLQGYEDGWIGGVDRYLEELPEEGYFLFAKSLLKTWIFNWDANPEIKPWIAEALNKKFWNEAERKRVLTFLDSEGSRDALNHCLNDAKKAF